MSEIETLAKGLTEDWRTSFEARFMTTRRIGQARWDEQKRIADKIEILLYEAKTVEACDVLVALAQHVMEGGKP